MKTCGVVMFALLLAENEVIAQQRAEIPAIERYPGSLDLCNGHVTGAPQSDGRTAPHITWTAYHSADRRDTVVAYYLKALGPKNHAVERGEDSWRFPADKPVSVLTITTPTGALPSTDCKPPITARAVIIVSSMAR